MQEQAVKLRPRDWIVPTGCEELYADLQSKFGVREARRLVEDHARAKGLIL